MSHNAYIHGVKIYLRSRITADADYGIYDDTLGGVNISVLRWIESAAPLTTSPTDWCATMLLGGGIEPHVEKVDLRQYARPVSDDGYTLHAVNASQFSLILSDAAISLDGCAIEKWEFVYNEDTGEVSREKLHTGSIESVEWTETELTISVSNALNKRRAQILTNNPIGDGYIPATFGEIIKAKMIRSEEGDSLVSNSSMASAADPKPVTCFPVVNVTSNLAFRIQIGTGLTGLGSANLPDTDDLWVTVVNGDNAGESRKVDTIAWYGPYSDLLVDITVSSYFPKSCSAATDDTNSWVRLRIINSAYDVDVWDCKDYLNDAGTSAVTTPVLYAYSENHTVDTTDDNASTEKPVITEKASFKQLPKYAYTISDVTNTGVEIDAKQCRDTKITEFDCPLILPCTSIKLCDDDTLEYWGDDTADKITDGIYSAGDFSAITTTVISAPTTDFPNATDADHTTYETAEWQFSTDNLGDGAGAACALVFKAPEIPDGYDFDKAYLILKIAYSWDENDSNHMLFSGPIVSIKSRRFIRKVVSPDIYSKDPANEPSGIMLNNLPDFYLSSSQNSNNEMYYTETYSNVEYEQMEQYGYSVFEISAEELKNGSLHEMMALLNFDLFNNHEYTAHVNFVVDIYEMAVAFVKTISINDAVYTNIRGRIYDDTWGSRKTAANLITTAPDVLEHVLRLQNWSEVGDNEKFGLEYSPNAKIKTSGDGSFDDTSLGPAGGTDVSAWLPKDIELAGQLFDEDQGWTDSIVPMLCRQMWCLRRQDNDGNECIHYIQQAGASSDLVTLADIIGAIDPIVEPQARDIYCEPIIRYNRNYGSDKYDSTMQVLHANDPGDLWATMDTDERAAYTPGITGSDNLVADRPDGEVIWEACHALYDKYGWIEPMPTEISECPMIRTYNAALWYLWMEIQWQGKRRTGFSVAYETGHDWHVGTYIKLQLPHQTNNAIYECMIESVKKDKASNRVTVTVILLSEIADINYYQDTNSGATASWQDTNDSPTTLYQDTAGE